jgi:hypothetical protein
MGLWLKNEDGFVPVSGGGGGSFDGEHVLTGDPDSPPEGWAAGQLLYDGLQDAAGDAGPHDHDYLPLSGGTVTGGLTVDGTLLFPGQTRMYANTADPDWNGLRGRVNDTEAFDFYDAVQSNRIYRSLRVMAHGDGNGDLIVDGQVNAAGGTPEAPAYSFVGGAGSSNMGMYKHANNQLAFSSAGAKVLTLHTTGVFAYTPFKGQAGTQAAPTFSFEADSNTGMYSLNADVLGFSCGNVKVVSMDSVIGGRFFGPGHATGSAILGVPDGEYPAYRFYGDERTGFYRKQAGVIGVSGRLEGLVNFRAAPGIDTRDVLDRAEVATMPAPDAEGVATADVESLTVNEVMTAMLAKIKELSARIETLEGN